MFAVLAGVAVVCAGTTAAALAGSQASVSNAAADHCQVLPAPPSSSATPPISPGGGDSTGTGSSPGSGGQSTPPSANPTEICISMSAATPSVYPGQNALYSVTVTAEGGTADDVNVQITLPQGQTTSGLPAPVFNMCNRGSGTGVCQFGNLRENQSIGAQAEVAVPSKSAGGGTVILSGTATAAAPGASTNGEVVDSATVDVNKSSSSTGGGHSGGGSGGGGGSKHHSGGSGSGNSGGSGSGNSGSGGGNTTGDSQPFDTLPPLTGSGSTPGSGSSSNLFPTINPSSGSGGSSTDSQTGKAAHKPYKATTVADILPLNSGQLSAQVAGLIVLFLGIVLVFARITLRKPRSSQTKD